MAREMDPAVCGRSGIPPEIKAGRAEGSGLALATRKSLSRLSTNPGPGAEWGVLAELILGDESATSIDT